jgi:hypothetical protein
MRKRAQAKGALFGRWRPIVGNVGKLESASQSGRKAHGIGPAGPERGFGGLLQGHQNR